MYGWLAFLLALLVFVVSIVMLVLHTLDTIIGAALVALSLAIMLSHVPAILTRPGAPP